MAGSLPVVLASDQSSIPVTVSGVATAAKQDTGNTLLGTIDADTGGIATSTASIDTKTPALGQALADASVPVVLTASQVSTLTPQTDALTDTQLRATPVPVSATDLDIRDLTNADVVTAELSATDNAVLDDIAAKLGTIDADTGALAGTVSGSEVQVDVVAALPAGTNAIGKLAANSGVDIGDVDVTSITGVTMSNAAMQMTGDEAHDDADAGNPVKVGFKAIAHGSNPSAVAANDRTHWYANRHGIPWVIGGHPNIVTVRANYTAAQTNTAVVTVSSGTKIVVTRCSVMADNANTVDVQARIGFATATTPTTTGTVLSHPGIAPGSGVVEGNGSGILGVGGDDEDVRITSEVPTGGSIDVVVSYYTIES